MREQLIILGIDPGTNVTGYGIIKTCLHKHVLLDFGTICPPKSASLPEKYRVLHEGVLGLIAKHRPDYLAIESQFMYKNPQSALKLGMAKGVIVLAATLRNIETHEYTPKKAKLAVVGKGSAEKLQVQKMIQLLLSLKKPPQADAADALALAICHAHQLKWRHHVRLS